MSDAPKSCGTCRHLYVRAWQLTHGTCEWIDAPSTIAPVWIRGNWPMMKKTDGAQCKAWEPRT